MGSPASTLVPCKNGAHAFDDIEEEVVGAIANWIQEKDFRH